MSLVSMISASAPTLPNFQLSYGPILIRVFFSIIIYGVPVIDAGLYSDDPDRNPTQPARQTLTYYQVYQRDPKWTRLFIAFLFFVETANTSLDMAMVYLPLILEYGMDLAVKNPYFSRLVLVSMPIQLLLAWGIHRPTNSVWIPAIISVLAIASFGTGILFLLYNDTNKLRMITAGGVWTATIIQILRQFAKKPLLHNSALLWFLAACAADILITVSLVMTLECEHRLALPLQSQNKTGFSGTDSVLDKIIRMTIQTGMITYGSTRKLFFQRLRLLRALFSLLDVACFMILPASLIHIYSRCGSSDQLFDPQHYTVNLVWNLSLSKLYCNCLMSALNAREGLRQQQNSVVLSLASNSTFYFSLSEPLTGYSGQRLGHHRRASWQCNIQQRRWRPSGARLRVGGSQSNPEKSGVRQTRRDETRERERLRERKRDMSRGDNQYYSREKFTSKAVLERAPQLDIRCRRGENPLHHTAGWTQAGCENGGARLRQSADRSTQKR
ncbi:hypothetical protein C8R45DRAFT_947170 [Mycena sanguinolenta]|nr:hypothetical protein C8R45DRAFT_947170 [Mycena sanguinolenta]